MCKKITVRSLVCLGDSHLEPLKVAAENGLINADSCTFYVVPGATAVGLRNPNSLTDALSIFKMTLDDQPVDSVVLMQLGEVDCGFVIWFRADKHGDSIKQQMQESLDAYESFVDYVLGRGFTNIIITGATLPTIQEGVNLGKTANARASIKSSLQERTSLTLSYNRSLSLLADRKNINYFDMTDILIDTGTCVVNRFFCHKDPADHHLDPEKTAALWASSLNRELARMMK